MLRTSLRTATGVARFTGEETLVKVCVQDDHTELL